jgi:hypothetical protein
MKKLSVLLLSVLFVSLGYSQDVIVTTKSDSIKSKIIEVTNNEIKYKKFDNIDGPVYSVLKSDVYMVKYQNGTSDIFNDDVLIFDEELQTISRKYPEVLIKKGNNVFIEIPDEASRAGEKYFIDALQEWGYWNIVDDPKKAHFIIVFNIDKKGMFNLDKKAQVTFKTRENVEFKKSGIYKAKTSAFSGYNSFYAVSKKIVKKYFMKEFVG